jgi:hypothetical protein
MSITYEPIQSQWDEEERSAKLVVDLDDPAFFDHELDHVPGMLIATSALELAEQEFDALSPPAVTFKMTYHAITELAQPVTLHARWLAPLVWEVSVRQAGRVVADGGLQPIAIPSVRIRRPRTVESSIDPVLVHREQAENAIVSEHVLNGDFVWSSMIDITSHYFARVSRQARGMALFIEAARQFSTSIAHAYGDIPFGYQFLLRGFTASLPVSFPKSGQVFLRWSAEKIQRKIHIELFHGSNELQKIGEVIFGGAAIPMPQYRKFRTH